ncbi:LysR family transcriptional regulator [Streptomyces boninensis]|uniref:LysR family transcriptional regulator n=1 Tax=Streptomyces boninensis TaxID=2039455 RepID=UPI003B20BF56
MESRPLRYFVAVAEELNFARAAERLGISAPPLSRAIRALEADLGATLFERTTHHVALTPAGEVLLAEARIALDALQAAGRRAQRAANTEPKLVLAAKADGDAGLLEPILERYAAESASAALPIEVRLCGMGEQPLLLRRGEADAALAIEPYDRTGLDAEPLHTEPRLAALPAADPRVSLSELTLADLGLPPQSAGKPPEPDGIRDLPQLLTRVALGETVALLPRSVCRRYERPGLAYRPVADAAPAVLTIAWPQQSRSMATAALVRAAVAAAAVASGRGR